MNEELDEVAKLIIKECDAIKEFLLEKNKRYGNSAFYPKRVFSKADPIEQIKVRIDDKISRIQSLELDGYDNEDSSKDLLGYLIILRVAKQLHKL